MRMPGRVSLVGAGPGDPGLLTVKAAQLIADAEVIVYDRLVSAEVLGLGNPRARLVAVGKESKHHPVPQAEINAILIREARAGRRVVRLKGGDPLIFGRGSEEAMALRDAGIVCDVVPGITAAQGCSASAGVPLTHRGVASGVRYITGHCRDDQPLDLDWKGLADPATTLVVYMGAANIAEIATRLVSEGLPRSTPVLAISNGTTPRERRVTGMLGHIAADLAGAGFDGPVLFIIGQVVSLAGQAPLCPLLRNPMAWLRPSDAMPREAPAHG